MSDKPLIGPEEVAGVLSGMGSAEPPSEAAPGSGQPMPYSLREPVAIPPQAAPEARRRLEDLVAAAREALPEDCGITVELDALQQQRAAAALTALPSPSWIVSFVRARGGGLALVFPSAVALRLVEIALGGSGKSAEEGRDPTPVEARVLPRMFAPSAPRFGETVGEKLSLLGLGIGELPEAVAAPGETMAVGLVRVGIDEGEHTALMLVTASLLIDVPGEEAGARPPAGLGPLAPLLNAIPVKCRPVLRAGRVSLSDLAEIENGKVLVLDAPEDTPIDLRIEGEPVYTGRIVRENGRAVFHATRRRARPAAEGRKSE